MSLKLGFSSKRQHDPKGIVDLHLKHNHFKTRYTHEESPDDFIYQGVDTFFEVLDRDKGKEEQGQILLYQKESLAQISFNSGILEYANLYLGIRTQ